MDEVLDFESRAFPTDALRARIASDVASFPGSETNAKYDYRYFLTEDIRKRVREIGDEFTNISEDEVKWPLTTPGKTMIRFLQHVGVIGLATPNIIVAKYLCTVEKLLGNSNGDFFENVMHMFAQGTLSVKLVQMNMSLIAMMNPDRLVGTPYSNLTQKEVYDKVDKLMGRLIRSQNFVRGCNEASTAVYDDRDPRPIIDIPIPNSMCERDLKPHQMLLEHLFQCAGAEKLRRTQFCIF